jgi:hypothetical protein
MTKGQRMRRAFGPQPTGPVDDSGAGPSPANCLRRRGVVGKCDSCGARPICLHWPTRRGGTFCGACCPCCTAPLVAPEALAGATSGGMAQ